MRPPSLLVDLDQTLLTIQEKVSVASRTVREGDLAVIGPWQTAVVKQTGA
jgi:hypothetical protein